LASFGLDVNFYFINTGFHFVETHVFKTEIEQLLNIEIKSIESPISKSDQKDNNGFFYYASNTDYCCHLNKELPTQQLLNQYDVWISGVRKDQSSFRKALNKFEQTPNGKLRYHPIIDWTTKMIYQYRATYNLPEHPLEKQGYFSVGCQPCTINVSGREGRWAGQNKTECGLHTNLINKQ
jgi:phosphoadenosine phosphosulfate reductase